MRMQGQANCPLNEPPDPGTQQRRSRRNGYRASARRTSVAFAAERTLACNLRLIRCTSFGRHIEGGELEFGSGGFDVVAGSTISSSHQ